MTFNSLHFLIFFPLVVLVYFLIPHRLRWLHLLLASCYFYMALIPLYVLILFFTILIDYVGGILIENSEGTKRKAFLFLSLVSNLGILVVFKYYAFLTANVSSLLGAFGISWEFPGWSIMLPIGLSFHTFQAMSYTIEVYRGNQKAERHLGIYALYVMFFPQLVAGPIERPQNLLHQFHEEHFFDYTRAVSGLRLMLLGLLQKVYLADRLAVYVNQVYQSPHDYNSTALFTATLAFTFQIYCDFSGYSNIALGAARVIGFTLMRNFNSPYLARSIPEFWKRWHISLSTWFRDYVYYPLGGNRVSGLKRIRNIFIVFLLSGFWHGANWTYVLWGLAHAFYYLIGMILPRPKSSPLVAVFETLYTFALVSLSWVFFRANTVSDAFYILKSILFELPLSAFSPAAFRGPGLWVPFIGLFGLFLLEVARPRMQLTSLFQRCPLWIRWGGYVAALLLLWNAGVINAIPFVYFQF